MTGVWGTNRIRVLVVDDSAFMRRCLCDILGVDPQIEVVGTARDGEEAVAKARQTRPDVVCLDVNMPRMDGLTALRYLLNQTPCAVLMVSSLTQEGAATTLEALELGAVDFVAKPGGSITPDLKQLQAEVIAKVKAAARAKPRWARERISPPPRRQLTFELELQPSAKVVAIGVSTGGPRTLMEILPQLPPDFPTPILVVQHMPESFTASFAQRLNRSCGLEVKEAADGDEVAPGRVLVARGGYHLKVDRGRDGLLVARLSRRPADALYFPSVNVTMRSLLDRVPARNVIGVLLTGMGSDGAEAMVEIRRGGGYTIAESEETAVIWGMPREAYLRGGAEVIAPSYRIAREIIEGVKRR